MCRRNSQARPPVTCSPKCCGRTLFFFISATLYRNVERQLLLTILSLTNEQQLSLRADFGRGNRPAQKRGIGCDMFVPFENNVTRLYANLRRRCGFLGIIWIGCRSNEHTLSNTESELLANLVWNILW